MATTTIAPVQQAERVKIVDILRGFALFGILFVNMILFPPDPNPHQPLVDETLPIRTRRMALAFPDLSQA